MGKKLAIRGHSTRGNEVIELLEMMGCVNSKNFSGKCDFFYFFIDNDNIIQFDSNFNNNFVYFTLERFLKENPYKVGDKVINGYGNPVTIKSMSWHDGFETMVYDFEETEDVFCAEDLEPYKKEDKLFDSIIWHLRNSINNGKQNLSGGECEEYFREVVKKNNENKMKIVLAELLEHIKTTPKEELEREFEEIKEWSNVGPTVEEFRAFCECVNKKPKYPDNYEECVRIAKNIHGYDIHIDVPAYGELMESFVKLLICRDAYWKIAAEEMGLDKPWKPDWKNSEEKRYCIVNIEGDINLPEKILTKWILKVTNKLLVFPTEEMRDAFYENFKDLIEQCKELL